MGKTEIAPGMKFNRLTAVRPGGRNKYGRKMWVFRCDCGREKEIKPCEVVSGSIKSCGCLLSYNARKNKPAKTHGLSNTRLFRIWWNMKYRCSETNKHADRKKYYEAGIRVCEEWSRFENFAKWAIENGYTDNLTIDRIDNAGNYEPSNCRWATRKEQVENRECTVKIEHDGQIHTLNDWADICGIPKGTFRSRYYSGKRGNELFLNVRKE